MTNASSTLGRVAKYMLHDRYADLLRFKWVQRALIFCSLASFLLTALLMNRGGKPFESNYAKLALILQIGLMLLMALSTRFVSFLPVTFLDERQIQSRTNAFAFAFRSFVAVLFALLALVAGIVTGMGLYLNRRFPEGIPPIQGYINYDPLSVGLVLLTITVQLALFFLLLPMVHLASQEAKRGGGIIRD